MNANLNIRPLILTVSLFTTARAGRPLCGGGGARRGDKFTVHKRDRVAKYNMESGRAVSFKSDLSLVFPPAPSRARNNGPGGSELPEVPVSAEGLVLSRARRRQRRRRPV